MILVQPVTGFHVASVHSMAVLSLMRSARSYSLSETNRREHQALHTMAIVRPSIVSCLFVKSFGCRIPAGRVGGVLSLEPRGATGGGSWQNGLGRRDRCGFRPTDSSGVRESASLRFDDNASCQARSRQRTRRHDRLRYRKPRHPLPALSASVVAVEPVGKRSGVEGGKADHEYAGQRAVPCNGGHRRV